MSEVSREGLRWDWLIRQAILALVLSAYGAVVVNSPVGIVAGALLALFASVIESVLTATVKAVDKHNLRSKLPVAARRFLRRNPQIRSWLGQWVALFLVSALCFNFLLGLFTRNALLKWTSLAAMLLTLVLTSIILSRFPDRSGRVVRFEEVQTTLHTKGLHAALGHFNKALGFFDDMEDAENAIKEAVCALEACLEGLLEESVPSFAQKMNQLRGNEPGQIPPPVAEAMKKLHAYRGQGKGIAHAALSGSYVSTGETELMLNMVAASLIYLCEVIEKP